MDQPHSTDQAMNSEIIDLTDIIEVGHTPAQQATSPDPDDDILDLDALLEQVEAKDMVAPTDCAANASAMPLPDLSELDDLLGDSRISPKQEDDFAAELDAILAEGPNLAGPNSPAQEQEEIALDDLDDLLASISPPDTAKGADQSVVDVNDLDSLLDSIMNPEPENQAAPDFAEQLASLESRPEPDLEVPAVMDLPEESIMESTEAALPDQPVEPEPAIGEPATAPAQSAELETLHNQVVTLQDRLEELASAAQTQPEQDVLMARLDKLQTEVQDMAESNALGLAAAEARISALETELATLATATSSDNGLVALDTRLTSLEASLADAVATVSPEHLAELESKLTEQAGNSSIELKNSLNQLEAQLRQELEAKLTSLPTPEPDQALLARLAALEAKDLEPLQNRLSALENATASSDVQDLHERLQVLEQLANPDLEVRLARLEEKLAAAQGAPNPLEQRLAELETRLCSLESNMEQAASASAAKVIREELANLLSDDD